MSDSVEKNPEDKLPSEKAGADGKLPLQLLLPQAFVGFIDSISYMVTAPSIIFYVLANGGSFQSYGIILSVFSFSSFLFKPVLGQWSDATGHFRVPYLTSLALACLGGLVYFSASLVRDGWFSIALIFLGRLLGGFGAANSTLGFAYIARVMDKSVLTQASGVLSMVRVLGMTTAPALNIILNNMHSHWTLYGDYEVVLTPLNSVGLLLALSNLAGMAIIFFLFTEPHQLHEDSAHHDDDHEDGNPIEERRKFWDAFLCVEIFIPILSVFTLNANFQLLEAGMAPAAKDALGWGPVEISILFGMNALIIMVAILGTMSLSSRGVKDEHLLTVGLLLSITGYTLLYILWQNPTTPVWFFVPICISTLAFPFLASPTRSIYTMVVDSKPSLRDHQGAMQAVLSMDASVAGFVAPGIISALMLRTPAQVGASDDGRELTAWALYAPVLSLLTLLGHLYITHVKKPLGDVDDTTTPLVSDKAIAVADQENDADVDDLQRDVATALAQNAQEDDAATNQCAEEEPTERTALMATCPKWSRGSYRQPKFSTATSERRLDTGKCMGIHSIHYHEIESDKLHAEERRERMSVRAAAGTP